MQAMIRWFAEAGCAPDEVVRAGRRLAADLDRVPGSLARVVVQAPSGLAMVSLSEEQASPRAAEGIPGACLAEHLPGLAGLAEVTTGEVVFQRG